MFCYEYKALLFLLLVNFSVPKSYTGIEDNKDDNNIKPAEQIMMASYSLPSQYPELVEPDPDVPDRGQLASSPPEERILGTTPVNSLLAAYLQSKDAKRTASVADMDHYVQMLIDGLLEELRPFHPRTDAEALQMVRDFIASRDVSSDLKKLKPEHANHEEWRERLKHLLFHYLKQPYVKQQPGLQRAMKWYLNRLKHTIWVRRRLSLKRTGITRMNLLFSYLQALDNAADQREYRFDIYKEIERTVALKKRLVKLSTSPEVKMNAELTAAFNYYIDKLTEALEEAKKHRPALQLSEIPIQNTPLFVTQQEIFPKKITTYIDIVQDFIERKKKVEGNKEILHGQSLDKVGGIRTFLEHYLTATEVKENATLSEAINIFLSKLKKFPSHHLLDRHLKRETMQKMVTKYEVVYEYLSKLEWKRSGSPNEVLQQALMNPEIQKNTTLLDAINFYLEHSPKDQEKEEEKEEEEQTVVEEKAAREPQLAEEEKLMHEEKAAGEEQIEKEKPVHIEEEEKASGEEQLAEEEKPIHEEEKAAGEEQLAEEEKPIHEEEKALGEEQLAEEEKSVHAEEKAAGEGQPAEEEKPIHEEEKPAAAVEEEKPEQEQIRTTGSSNMKR